MSIEKVQCLLDDYITAEELGFYTNRYNAACSSDSITPTERFEYALALTRSRYRADQMRAINMLEDLCITGDPKAFRDYLFYVTIANIKLQNYERARECVKKFLAVEPENRQAIDLKEYIESKIFRDGVKGMAIVGGVAVAVGAVVALAIGKRM